MTFVLSGDKKSAVAFACEKSGIDEYKAELLPAEKVAEFEKIMNTSKGATVYVGDGINDSPVLARSDVGIAMGGVGQDAAIEAADIVIMDDDIGKIPIAVKVAKKTMGIVWQNIIFALGVKLLVLVLTLFGVSSMGLAVFADVGVSALAIINALRALK
jgi:Cd2+/Zn2+-exporting ATPase